MSRVWAFPLILFVISVSLSCGTGTHRYLESINISSTANGQQISFVATGTFTAPPTTVTPLPVDWTLGLMAPPPQEFTYTLTTQPYVFNCANAGAENLPVVAFAPINPDAPNSGTTKTVVTAASPVQCQ